MGFCLGGNFVLELARRVSDCALLAVYPFPQGLPNVAPLAPPIDYLPKIETPVTILLGDTDASVGAENVEALAACVEGNPAVSLHIFRGVGHGRSEEHTSELQSLMRISYAVFCLKKKNQSYSRPLTKTYINIII